MLIGVISDTHGLLRPEALDALRSVDHILHAGDVGNIDILEELRTVAPVTAVRGNIDTHGPCSNLPATEAVDLGGHLIYMLHSLDDLDIHPHAAGMSIVISGHSHRPSLTAQDDVMYLNPGSAGPRRFSLPVTVAHLRLESSKKTATIQYLLP
jgi:putative phosphoesterase